MKSIYNSLISRINSGAQLFTDNGLKPIVHMDRFKGQYLNPELHLPYAVPALFFKFNIIWEEIGANNQRGNGILEVHVELENYHESSGESPDKDAALVDYDYLNIVQALLQGYEGSTFNKLSRQSTDEDENPSTTNVTIVRYAFTTDDYANENYAAWVAAKLDDINPLTRKAMPVVPAVSDTDKFVV